MKAIDIIGAAALYAQPGGTGYLHGLPVARPSAKALEPVHALRKEPKLKSLDRVTLLALQAAQAAYAQAGAPSLAQLGINIGSARGATHSLEAYHREYLNKESVGLWASPHTTAGHIAATLAQHLGAEGPSFTHSITCSSAGFALANAAAYLRSGMATTFLAGGAEAPLTPFILAQMKALGIYTQHQPKPLDARSDGMMLGEGAAAFALTLNAPSPMARLTAFGFGNERIPSPTGITEDGHCLQRSMQQAIDQAPGTIDLVLCHAPGTPKGDQAELNAIRTVFGENTPPAFSTKWYTGHTFGASAGISLAVALDLLQGTALPDPPYTDADLPKSAERILINSVGFGGNAISFIVEK